MLFIAPTAIAAMNIEGVTIHSLFKFELSDFLILDKLLDKDIKSLKSILKKTDILVIDEVSMLRPDIFDSIDLLCRRARSSNFIDVEREPVFGGLQILLVGDLCQLPPVIKSNTYEIFKKAYGHKLPYFFDSNAYKKGNFQKFEFLKVYRQSDKELLSNLIKIRNNQDVESAINYFNTCKILNENKLNTSITITPYRNVAEAINQKYLGKIQSPIKTYVCQTNGVFDEKKESPAPRVLTLKQGALVIFNKNGTSWINGTSEIIEELQDDVILVKIISSGEIVSVKREDWKIYKYEYNRDIGVVTEIEIGSFTQFPLQLGYALTIHKAQGKTLDSVKIDIDKGAFAHGQLYVALSRTRKKSDIHISKRTDESDVIIDKRITEFLNKINI